MTPASTWLRRLRRGVVAAGALVTALSAAPASAHLIPAQQGTVNVVGTSVFAVLSVPVSALTGADDDGDGVVTLTEFERHEGALRAEIDRRLGIRDGDALAETVRVDLILSPQHDAPADRSDQIVALKHARFPAAPRALRVESDLFGSGASEKALKITATRPAATGTATGTETQVAVLTPDTKQLAFFAPPAPSKQPSTAGLARLALPAGLVAALLVASAWLARRARKPVPQPA